MKAFEIQTFAEGKWKIDSVFDDRELAMFEARRIDQSTRYSGVRVAEETFDEESQLSTTRTIFRGRSADRQIAAQNNAQRTPIRNAKPRQTGGGAPRRAGAKRPRPKAKSSGFAMPLVVLTVIVAVGIGALFGLQELWGSL